MRSLTIIVLIFLASSGAAAQEMNTLTAEEKAAGWKLLFDGKTTNGWRAYRMPAMDTLWSVKDGTLTKTRSAKDIVTTETFKDFELSLEWRLGARQGNAGIFYRAQEDTDHVYWTAPEYQLGTDSTPDTRYRGNYIRAPGAVYDFYPGIKGSWKNEGEWNRTRIIVKGTHVEHWLNDQKIAEYEYWSPDFEAKFRQSKFARFLPNPDAKYAGFARATSGHIAIQGDHRGELSLRNVKIRELR
jgi:hypothetical protein